MFRYRTIRTFWHAYIEMSEDNTSITSEEIASVASRIEKPSGFLTALLLVVILVYGALLLSSGIINANTPASTRSEFANIPEPIFNVTEHENSTIKHLYVRFQICRSAAAKTTCGRFYSSSILSLYCFRLVK